VSQVSLTCVAVAKVKKANAGLDHKEAFKVAAGNWKTSKENPVNKN
jgi:hypothetical protein